MSRTAVITGTASGIGRATALAFLRDGYKVLGVDVKPMLGAVEVDFKQRGGYRHIIADISDSRDVFSLTEAALDFFPSHKVNVIVNNAGIADPFFPSGGLPGACMEHWGRVIATNLTGTTAMVAAPAGHVQRRDTTLGPPGCGPHAPTP